MILLSQAVLPTHTAKMLSFCGLQHNISEAIITFCRKMEQLELNYCVDQHQALWLVRITGDLDSHNKTGLFHLPNIPSNLLP